MDSLRASLSQTPEVLSGSESGACQPLGCGYSEARMGFSPKLPCRLSRLLDEGQCHPCNEPHDVKRCLRYYDTLYYPQFNLFLKHPNTFAHGRRLRLHLILCVTRSVGCVSYDGVCITMPPANIMPPSEFADAGYHYCVVLHKLSSCAALCCCLTNIYESWCPLAESASVTTIAYGDVNYSTSGGAQSTQRPLAFPVAHLSTMLGWEHVTACVAVSLR